ncbi:MAG: hypothetical protein DRQ55_03610 [Planctomycetota bacterium]|nr:MAG: hypothetical protein DRQ55_03610 [Planctomycetota bacterium]
MVAGRLMQRRRSQLGFSLVEILVVITLIGLLMTFGFNAMQSARDNGNTIKCADNLRQIGSQLLLFKDQRNKGRWPNEVGMRFLLSLHKFRETTGRQNDVFTCPGTQDRNDLGADGEMGSSYDDWDNISSADISYAGRDAVAYPIRGKSESEQVLAADDNEFGPNHQKVINVLYGDGSVQAYDVFIDGADVLAAYPEYEELGIPVGPDSPVELFQVLRID